MQQAVREVNINLKVYLFVCITFTFHLLWPDLCAGMYASCNSFIYVKENFKSIIFVILTFILEISLFVFINFLMYSIPVINLAEESFHYI